MLSIEALTALDEELFGEKGSASNEVSEEEESGLDTCQ